MDRDFLRIKEAIKKAGYTYESFGVAVGLSKTSIARIVSGDQTPSFDTLKLFADTLKLDVGDLFVSKKQPNESIYTDEKTGKKIKITEL